LSDPYSAKRLVRHSYDRLGRRYREWARGIASTARHAHSNYLLTELPEGSCVLDLGCGDGSLLTQRLTNRFRVVGVDISSIQLAEARANAIDAHFICADMSELTLPDETFHAVTAFYSLSHLPPSELPAVLRSIAGWLRPGGILIASLGCGEQDGAVEPDWIGVPMYFSGHASETNRDLVAQSGLRIEHDSLATDEEYGQAVTFHWIIARKPGHE
jgi:SAM-dependent methyltransferase